MNRQRWVRVGLGCVLVVLGLACSLPTGSEEPDEAPPATLVSAVRPKGTPAVATAVPSPVEVVPTEAPEVTVPAAWCSGREASYADIGFCYDPALASDVEILLREPVAEEVLFGDTWALPERIQVGLKGYPMGLDRQGMPHFMVYPVVELRDASPRAAEMLDEIERLVDTRPGAGVIEEIPVFLPANAAQVYRARVHYLADGNARGVAFLTAYAQDLTPVVNESLTYVYEGFIGDGRDLVVARLPVYHDSLRDTWAEYSQEELAPLYDDYAAYLDEALANLEMQPAGSFLPSLDLLDAMMVSVQVR